jgi:hypothetical protein
MKHQYIIPGKAYEVLSRNVHGNLKDALAKGEKKNKGRGYRVFVTLTGKQASELADILVHVETDKPAVQLAVREAIERLSMNGDPENDEIAKADRIQQNRLAALAKGRAARAKKAAEEVSELIWPWVSKRVQRDKCNCGLQSGMTLDELRPLGAGCTSPNYVCPALDAYRRLLKNPASIKGDAEEAEAA